VGILRWSVGDATVLRAGELDATPAFPGLIRELDPDDLSRASWLRPHFVDQTGALTGLVQAFLVLIAGDVIIVDPGVGNGKRRTAVPGWNDLQTDFLDQLARSGVAPDRVDYVVNTHLHFDHVGWHTRLVDGMWQPTFPNARYVMSAEEFRYWRSFPQDEIPDQLAGFADSVLPVQQAGLVDLVADDHVVSEGVRLLPTPGHTPHHVSVVLESAGQSAVITGDVMHHPCQIAYPRWGAVSDFDPGLARSSRADFVDRFVDSDTLVIGSHFSDPVAGYIRRDGEGLCFRSDG
jgi:glyoxylase-like metal-dependent hydrolase (beta-lactamase superfamily II)